MSRTTVPLQARAVPTFWRKGRFWFGQVRHGSCQVSGILGSIFFVFLNHARTITYKTIENNEKTNKTKAIKLVGCLPRSARLKSLA